jgi:hypothetical protein
MLNMLAAIIAKEPVSSRQHLGPHEATGRRAEGATLDELARSYDVGISTIRRATRVA